MRNIIPKKAYKIKFLNSLGFQPKRYVITKLVLNFRKNKLRNESNSYLNIKGIEFFNSPEEESKMLKLDFRL